MRDKAFFDTNILIYALAEQDLKTKIAEGLLENGGVVSIQVLNELAHVARRKLKMPWDGVLEALSEIRVLCPKPVAIDLELHDSALRIAGRYGFGVYDALIVAAALKADCTILYSEDLQHGQQIEGRLTVLNPFTRPDSSRRARSLR